MDDITRLKLNGYPALLADHCELADAVAALTVRVASWKPRPATRIDSASTATRGQTYTWLPGDAWSQYCEAQP